MKLSCFALACSPRKEGNTALLAKKALEACKAEGLSTEFRYLIDADYGPCRACMACSSTGQCIIDDDTHEIFNKFLSADRVIIAAPVYSMGICAQAKMLIDRAQQFWALKYLLNEKVIKDNDRPKRKGIFISCAGTEIPGVFDGTIRVVKYFFKMLEIEFLEALCYSGIDKKGDILKNKKALAETERYGKYLANS